MRPYLIFFVDENLKQGEIPFERIEKSLPGVIKITDYIHFGSLQSKPDKELIKHFNEKLKELNCNRRFKAFFVTCDNDFPVLWGELKDEERFQKHPHFHLIHLNLRDAARRQEKQIVEPSFYDTRRVKSRKVKKLREVIRKEIIDKCRKFLEPVH